MGRVEDLDRLYALLDRLEERVGGKRRLGDCTGHMDWPERGVYFFFAPDERREDGDNLRLTRVGTHAVSAGSSTSMWNRLRAHRGNNRGTFEGAGNHRGSVFRKRVGEAIIARDGLQDVYPQWGEGSSADREVRLKEVGLERRVSDYIGDLPFIWVRVDDPPGPDSDRAYLERNAIALASNYWRDPVDPRTGHWLGNHSGVATIRRSGLWNSDHVDEEYDPAFLDRLAEKVPETTPP
ncbi:hypothetical protein BRD00_08860 [Halobacteriales archaeon QS_8_69_26]|nr:MAG: hypothetical protein BRD00_08860 [Halobacteriales archaeon QS_8_69_26]